MHDERHPDPSGPTRRALLTAAALGAAGGLAGCASARGAPPKAQDEPDGDPPGIVRRGAVVLFQGDSITDAGRARDAVAPNLQPGLGSGYAWLAASGLLVARPAGGLRIHNRGVSGDRVLQLAERWDADCLALAPDVLSILIGVNDYWHTRGGGHDGTPERYEREYDELLRRTRAALPRVALVVCEPFLLPCGYVDATWRPAFAPYRAAARRLATAHGATWVGFQAAFDEGCRYAPPEHWAEDGVHPSWAGAGLMARTWLRAVET